MAERPRVATVRRGVSVVELLVALPLIALVLALATALLLRQLRQLMDSGARQDAARTLGYAGQMLAHDLREVAAGDLIAWTDSSVQADVPIVVGVSCGAPSSDVVDLVMSDGPLRALRRAEPDVGDRVVWAVPDTSPSGAAPPDTARANRRLRAHARVANACTGSVLRGVEAPLRVTLDASGHPSPPPGVLVLILRRVEWRAYRAADGEVWLGRRERRGTIWSVVQPAVGPLLAPAAQALGLSVHRLDGTPASVAQRDAAWLRLQLRAPRRGMSLASRVQMDSLSVLVALRGGD